MPAYQIWLLGDQYDCVRLLANTETVKTWQKLRYVQTLNDMSSCAIDLLPNAAAIEDVAIGRRVAIYRDGQLIWGGFLSRIAWEVAADGQDTYSVNALDYACYASWRHIIPAAGAMYDRQHGAADDVAKAFVTNCLGTTGARLESDVVNDTTRSAGVRDTEEARYDNFLTQLIAIGKRTGIRWRFVSLSDHVEFRTAYPYWGQDHREGNNGECVWSLDRRNIRGLQYVQDATDHANYVYVAGQGEEENRMVVEVSDSAAIAAYHRRETFVDARQLSLASSLAARGQQELTTKAVVEQLTAEPLPGSWRNTWDLGDIVTIKANKYGRKVTKNVEITQVTVEVGADGVEIATPEVNVL